MALDRSQFDRLVTDDGPALYRLAYRLVGDAHEAEDIVQDTFRSAWKSRRRFDSERNPRAWLATILRRRVADRWRRKSVTEAPALDANIEIGIEDADPFEQDFSDEVQMALDRLPNELKETLLLVVVGELTHQEAADLLNIPLGTVLSRVSRSRKKLRESMMALSEEAR
ncbi:MAG: RNA polymerase sigma factor [Pirellulales bacterium]|nr:RNA polymerase sigma factor [Pirellulales bacterium]